MLETQLAQLAAATHTAELGKIPRQPESTLESVNAVTTDGVSRLGDHLLPVMQKNSRGQEEVHGEN